ncbi:MAG: GldG family protein [Lachnospiraceae bacterium]|nr:GldG family protein [Lachnospiraceae bacterium]
MNFRFPDKKPKQENGFAVRGGSYSILITAVVLALLIAVNVLVSVLPSGMTRLDISAANLYSVTSQTKSVVNNLDQDVTIYWIVQANQEDSVIENLLSKYESLSEHLTVVKKNPDTYPTFTAEYTDETVANNSLIVESGDKSRYIAYSSIYLTEADYTTYSYSYSFDGEGAITSAIGYVTSEELPKIYTLSGHGESDLPSSFSSQLTRENYETESFSLLNEDTIPEDAAAILIYAPTSDISDKEAELLLEYVNNGGKLLVFAGPVQDSELNNLYSLLSSYGVERAEGITVEGDRDHYAFQSPYILLPEIESSDITDPLISGNYNVLVPLAQGLIVAEDASNAAALLTTSDSSYSKAAGYSMETYEKEEGDTDGSFTVGVSVTNSTGGSMIWYGSSLMLEDEYNSYSSGANLDLAMNSLSSLVGETESVSIRSKSLSYNYLTISDSTASVLKVIMIGVLPAAFLIFGICVIIVRRQRNYEEK